MAFSSLKATTPTTNHRTPGGTLGCRRQPGNAPAQPVSSRPHHDAPACSVAIDVARLSGPGRSVLRHRPPLPVAGAPADLRWPDLAARGPGARGPAALRSAAVAG